MKVMGTYRRDIRYQMKNTGLVTGDSHCIISINIFSDRLLPNNIIHDYL